MRRWILALFVLGCLTVSSPAEAKKKKRGTARDNKMLIGGIVITGLGVANAIAGAVALGVGFSDEAGVLAVYDCEDGACPVEAEDDLSSSATTKNVGGLLLLVGVVCLGVGIPFWLVGSHRLDKSARAVPRVRVGSDRMTLTWDF